MTYDENREIDEAVNAANDALYHLQKADELMDKAKNWGWADIFGGGMIITAIKHSRINDARREIQASQRALKKLANELHDLNGYPDVDIDIDGFVTFADYFFDNSFGDILAQVKISEAKKKIEDAIDEVSGILDGLEDNR